jgi:predicted PolB exonuclease-like 3'-5' exonuclease
VRFRVFDIETVPDTSVWTPGEPKWRWEVEGRQSSNTMRLCCRASEMVLVKEDPFPPPHACRVVAISWVDVVLDVERSPRYRFYSLGSECRWSRSGSPDAERDLLRSFGESTQVLASQGGLCLVTWNGRGFDLPVINLRSLMHGLPCRWYYENRDVRYRYSTEGHLDLMDFLGDYGAARYMKLGDVARLVGLPGKTGPVRGASVHGVYRETLDRPLDDTFYGLKRGEISRYCLQDSIQTALIFLRSRYHLGKIDGDEYGRCLFTFENDPKICEAIEVDWDAVRLPEDTRLPEGVLP